MENNSAEALNIIAETRAAAADRLITPWWYHPIFGLLLADYVLGVSLGTTPAKLTASLVFIAASLALATTYRRLTGVWVSGFDAGPAGRWAKALGALVGIAALGGWAIASWTQVTWPVWCLAVLALAGGVVLGRRFDSALRAQLRAGA
jgi:hypothetical protein